MRRTRELDTVFMVLAMISYDLNNPILTKAPYESIVHTHLNLAIA